MHTQKYKLLAIIFRSFEGKYNYCFSHKNGYKTIIAHWIKNPLQKTNETRKRKIAQKKTF